MSTDSGFKIIVGDETLMDLTNVNATAADVKEGRQFVDKYGQYVEGTYTVPTQEKTVSPSTSGQEVTPDTGKYLSKVAVNPILIQEKTVEYNTEIIQPDTGYFLSKVKITQPITEEIEVTPLTSKQTITPSSNKDYISKVAVNPISTQEKTVKYNTTTVVPDTGYFLSKVNINQPVTEEINITPSTSTQTITPSSEKDYISKVTVNAIPTQEKTVTPTTLEQEITPDTGKYLSKVVIGGISTEIEKLNKLIGGGF